MTRWHVDVISPDSAGTLHGLLRERIRRTPKALACRFFDLHKNRWEDLDWQTLGQRIGQWRAALASEPLAHGDRVAVMMRNCPEWVMFEQAALSLGLVVVPLFTNDRADNVLFILQEAGVKILLIENDEQWQTVHDVAGHFPEDLKVLALEGVKAEDGRVQTAAQWLDSAEPAAGDRTVDVVSDDLATIIYTSGTTGRPKGVMLSHANVLWNAYAGVGGITVYREDLFLSFLPLSHALERTVGYYIPIMTGAGIAYARSVQHLADDLVQLRPTILVSVPRIFERIHSALQAQLEHKPAVARALFGAAVSVGWQRFQRLQKRGSWHLGELLWPLLHRLVARKILDKLGGRLRLSVCGGAPLAQSVARVFLALEVPIFQGYGLTEASPIISVNRLGDNVPDSIGVTLPGIETRIDERGELLTRSPCVMRGYWNNPAATAEVIDADGWLHTGDLARQEGQHLFITGRLKDIIVMANGEKVPPADMEMAIVMDPLFEQVVVIGEGRPYLTAIAVVNAEQWGRLAGELGVAPDDRATLSAPRVLDAALARISAAIHEFPGYARIKRITLTLEQWTVENGLATPTLKVKRQKVLERFTADVAAMYEGH